GGSPSLLPWLDKVGAVLNMYLPGQAGGIAAAQILTGRVNPSGRLAESWPCSYEAVPNAHIYGKDPVMSPYMESIYIGYRYYDKIQAAGKVLFPFGYGLSYSKFEYRGIELERLGAYDFRISVRVGNTGAFDGMEVILLYVSNKTGCVHCPEKELKGFEKLLFIKGEEKSAVFTLDKRSFASFDPETSAWEVYGGEYVIMAGRPGNFVESRVILEPTAIAVKQQVPAKWYSDFQGRVTGEDFKTLLGEGVASELLKPAAPCGKGSYDVSCSISDIRKTLIGRLLYRFTEKTLGKDHGGVNYDDPEFRTMMTFATTFTFRSLMLLNTETMKPGLVEGILKMANGRWLRGIWTMLSCSKKNRRL
ncbi:MAG: hypothetical protein HGA22_11480, partial [Clostridiales bacterium]|nr:hypothetical protein [Clostridiales bacterium]